MNDSLHPILSCEQSLHFEQALLADTEAEWAAMQRAGSALAQAMLGDWAERGNDHRFSTAASSRLLVLAGKGHNGGDALLAAAAIARQLCATAPAAAIGTAGASDRPVCEIVVCLATALADCRPLCRRAWEELLALAGVKDGSQTVAPVQVPQVQGAQVHVRQVDTQSLAADFAAGGRFLFCIDGLLGMQFCPPLREPLATLLDVVNSTATQGRIGLRAAVDLPSGLGDAHAFAADFTYATGIAKEPVFAAAHAAKVGRLRYLDLGFFCACDTPAALAKALAEDSGATDTSGKSAHGLITAGNGGGHHGSSTGSSTDSGIISAHGSVLTAAVLDPLRDWRPPLADKRHYGHLFIVGGSAAMPGALLMNVLAALHSGVGLVTVFAPESVSAALAARAPEAMWVPWPQTEEGTLALEGQHLLATRLPRADALLMGSGMGQSAETNALLADVARTAQVPLVLDADALRPPVLAAATARTGEAQPLILTPHAGEFSRLSGLHSDAVSAEYLRAFCRTHGAVTVLKGAPTRIADARSLAFALFGGPVLARGGSGDVLAGLVGGLLAQLPADPLTAARRAAVWHGLAAQRLARTHGAVSVTTTDLIAMLAAALRDPQ